MYRYYSYPASEVLLDETQGDGRTMPVNEDAFDEESPYEWKAATRFELSRAILTGDDSRTLWITSTYMDAGVPSTVYEVMNLSFLAYAIRLLPEHNGEGKTTANTISRYTNRIGNTLLPGWAESKVSIARGRNALNGNDIIRMALSGQWEGTNTAPTEFKTRIELA